MKKIITILTMFLFLAGFRIIDNDQAFKKLYRLEGTWKMIGKRGAVYEEWKMINRNYLQNRTYILKDADTIVSERVSLTNTKNGIFYTPVVEDQNSRQPVVFKMTRHEYNKFIFENPEHDFPKRIVYHLVTDDSLHAFIDDGTEAGKKQNFYFNRQ